MMKKMRRCALIAVLLCVCCLLCACGGEKTVSVRNEDGTRTVITYENHGTLVRAPVFTRNGNTVTMQFNGTEWYEATPIGEKEREQIAENELLAESSNIRVYRNPTEDEFDYGYIYVIRLDGSDGAYIAVSSLDAPDHHGYGTDFDYYISYSVDGVETVPDMDWKPVE